MRVSSLASLAAVLLFTAKALASWRSVLSSGGHEHEANIADSATQEGRGNRVPNAQQLDIPTESHSKLFSESHGALQEYASKPDCFRKVADATKCEELEKESDARVRAAIEMTRCEIATAKQLPPLECSVLDNAESLSACVEALSRSAQFWSSYSGYLREVTTLCHALRHLHGLDEAKSLYAALAHEKAALLALLKAKELLWKERDRSDRERAVEDRLAWDQARRAADMAVRQGTEAALRTREAAQEVVNLVSRQTSTLDKFLARLRNELGIHIDDQLSKIVSKLAKAADNSVATTESLLAARLNTLATDHEAALRRSTQSIDQILLQTMDNVDTKARHLSEDLQSSLDLAQASREQQVLAFDVSRIELHHLAESLVTLRNAATAIESSLTTGADMLAHVVEQQDQQTQKFKGIIDSLAEVLKEQKRLLDASRAHGGWWSTALFRWLGLGSSTRDGLSTFGPTDAAWEDRVLNAVERIAQTGWLQAVIPASTGHALALALRGAAFSMLLSLRAGAFCLRYLLTLLVCTLALSCRAARPLWSRLLNRLRRFEASLERSQLEPAVDEAKRSGPSNATIPTSQCGHQREALILSPLQAPPSRFPNNKPSTTLSPVPTSRSAPSRNATAPAYHSRRAPTNTSRMHPHPFDVDLS